MKHRMKRILIFSLAYYPHVGGAEVALKEITDRIHDAEFHLVTLRFADEPREERIGNVAVHRVSGGSSYLGKVLFAPRAARRARQLHRAHSFDAFWAMMSYMLFPIVLLRARGIRVPYLLTLQEGDPFEHVFKRLRILPLRPLLASGFKHASAVQAISTFLAGWARQAGFPGTPDVIPNGVDLARFAGTPVPHEGTVLITASRLVPKNALDDAIRALASLPDVRFRILGVGPEEGNLRALARTAGVAERVEFVGQVGHARLPAELHAADVFVRPSRSEGMGNAFIEAMAAGVPVVATQEGGIADFLFDAKRNPDTETTGWAVDKDSPEQIARAVEDILDRPENTARVTAAARKLVTEKYDWNLLAPRVGGLFDRMLGNR